MQKQRRALALIGALTFWIGVASTVLFGAAAVWLLFQGDQPSWILLLACAALIPAGWLLVRASGIRLGDALIV